MPCATSSGVVFHDSPSTVLPSGRVILIGFDSFAAEIASTSVGSSRLRAIYLPEKLCIQREVDQRGLCVSECTLATDRATEDEGNESSVAVS